MKQGKQLSDDARRGDDARSAQLGRFCNHASSSNTSKDCSQNTTTSSATETRQILNIREDVVQKLLHSLSKNDIDAFIVSRHVSPVANDQVAIT